MIFRRFSKSFIGIPLFIIGIVTSSCLYGQSNHAGETSGTGMIIRGVVRSVNNTKNTHLGILQVSKNVEESFDKIYVTSESQVQKQQLLKNLNAVRDFEFYGKPIETTFVLYLSPDKTTILYQSYPTFQIATQYNSLHDGVIDSYTRLYPPFEKNSYGTTRTSPELANILLFTPELFQRKRLVDHFTKAESKNVDGDIVETYTAKSTPKKNPLGASALIYTIPQNPEKPIRLEMQWKSDTGNESTNIVFPQTNGNPIETTATILVDGFLNTTLLNAKSTIKDYRVLPDSDLDSKNEEEFFEALENAPKPIKYPYGPPKPIEELKQMDKTQNPPAPKPTLTDKIKKLF